MVFDNISKDLLKSFNELTLLFISVTCILILILLISKYLIINVRSLLLIIPLNAG